MNISIPTRLSTHPRIIVTGGAGFIGSHLVDYLLKIGHEVLAIDDLSTGSLANLKQALRNSNFTLEVVDVCAFDWRRNLRPDDTVVHLASTVGVLKVCEDAIKTSDNNHQMLEVILAAVLPYRNRLLYASTSEVYGDSQSERGSKETDLLSVHVQYGGRSAYTLSKIYGEMRCLAYQSQYQLPVTVMRFFNTTGPRQSAAFGMVVPKFMQQATTGKPITVFGSGNQVRSFCSVFDAVRAIHLLMQNPAGTGVFNIGNPEAITIQELAEYCIQLTGSRSVIKYLEMPPERAGHADIQFRKPDISHIKQSVGWKPQLSWQQTVQSLMPVSSSIFAQ